MKYVWNNVGFKADANSVGKELEQLERTTSLTNEEVLKYAKSHQNSELHKCFEWDDKIAGEKFRMQQATKLLCSISIVYEDNNNNEEKTRIYVSTRTRNDEKRTFKKITDVLEDDEEYKALLDKANNELNNCQQKYRDLIKLQDLKDIIFDIYKKM